MQQPVYERTIYAPVWQLAFINEGGPRVGESGFGLIARFLSTAPYDITLKGTWPLGRTAKSGLRASGSQERGRRSGRTKADMPQAATRPIRA